LKKILILAYDFPPFVSAGSLRPFFLAKYLSQFGHDVTVVTRQWDLIHNNHLGYIAPSKSKKVISNNEDGFLTIRSPYFPSLSNRIALKENKRFLKLIGKILSALTESLQLIFPIGPKRELYKAADHFLTNNNVDVIIATGDPFILFKYAKNLSHKNDIPWVADYRDPWSQDFSIKHLFLLKRWYKWNEIRIVKTSNSIITVSDFLGANLKKLIKNKEVTIIPNGYDHEIIDNNINKEVNNEILQITLAGTIYKWNPIESFLEKLSHFVEEFGENSIRFNLYGINIQKEIEVLISKRFQNLSSVIGIYPKTPYSQLIEKLSKSDVLLLFNYYSSMGTKIFDYVGLNKKILFCYSDDLKAKKLKEEFYLTEEDSDVNQKLQEELINFTNSGMVIKNEDDLHQTLKKIYFEHKANGFIKNETINSELYSRKSQIKKISNLIQEMNEG